MILLSGSQPRDLTPSLKSFCQEWKGALQTGRGNEETVGPVGLATIHLLVWSALVSRRNWLHCSLYCSKNFKVVAQWTEFYVKYTQLQLTAEVKVHNFFSYAVIDPWASSHSNRATAASPTSWIPSVGTNNEQFGIRKLRIWASSSKGDKWETAQNPIDRKSVV